jgi:peptidoglycan/LPS O-acetylase OafA/YrhL
MDVRRRFVVLDSWRGISALLVALHNADCSNVSFLKESWLFVDLFFVLSGFVITYAYMDKLRAGPEVGTYMLRRFGRLWPLHFVLLVALVGLEGTKVVLSSLSETTIPAFQNGNSIASILQNILLIQAIGVHSEVSWNIPSWTISTEFWTYLIFGMICLVFPKQRPPMLLMGGIALFAAAIIVWCVPNFLGSNTHFVLLRCIYGFFVGHLVYRAWTNGPSHVRFAGILEVAMIFLIVVFVSTTRGNIFSMVAPVVFGLAVWLFAYERGLLSVLLTRRLFTGLGTLSYSIYMIHWPVLIVIARVQSVILSSLKRYQIPTGSVDVLRTTVCDNSWRMYAALALYLLIVVGAATVTFKFVEQPGRRFFNRIARRLTQV